MAGSGMGCSDSSISDELEPLSYIPGKSVSFCYLGHMEASSSGFGA